MVLRGLRRLFQRDSAPTPAEVVSLLAGAKITAISSDEEGRMWKVDLDVRGMPGRIIADGAGEGWNIGDAIAETGVDEDGTLTVIAAQTALVVRPDPKFEAWQVEVPGRYSPVVCAPGGEVVMFNDVGWFARLLGPR